MIRTNTPSTSRNGMRRNTRSEASHRARRWPAVPPRPAWTEGIPTVVLASAIQLSSRALCPGAISRLAQQFGEGWIPATSAGMPRCRLIFLSSQDWITPTLRDRARRSELVQVDAALDRLAPDLDLMIPADLVGDLVPAHL